MTVTIIKKLNNLAKNNSNSYEKDSALARVQQLYFETNHYKVMQLVEDRTVRVDWALYQLENPAYNTVDLERVCKNFLREYRLNSEISGEQVSSFY